MNTLALLAATVIVGAMVVMVIIVLRVPNDELKPWGTTLVAVIATGLGTVLGYYFQQQHVDEANRSARVSLLEAEAARQVGRDMALRCDSAAAFIREIARDADSSAAGIVIDPARFSALQSWEARLTIPSDSTIGAVPR